MIGISANGKESIGNVVEEIFNRIALQFIGDIPRLKNTKRLVISGMPNYNLAHLFVQAMENKRPNEIEKDALKSLLESSHGYIESLKSKTKSNVTERIDGLIKESNIKNRKPNQEEINSIINEELGKAGSHLKSIVESESTKLRNVGTMMEISKVSSSIGDDDPTIFFIMVRDSSTCKECIRLHTVDGVTPKLWKFSELKQGYHKRGENNPSAFGLHPHCRCTMSYLAKGFGFDKSGKVTFVESGHDAYKIQKTI